MNPYLAAALALLVSAPAAPAAPVSPGTPPGTQSTGDTRFLDVQALDLEEGTHAAVIVDFWASWCGPCARAVPWFEQQRADWEDAGVRIVGVCLDPEVEPALRFLEKHAGGFPMIHDPEGTIARRYDIQGMPTTILFDGTGTERYRHTGFRNADRESITEQIHALLGDSPGGDGP